MLTVWKFPLPIADTCLRSPAYRSTFSLQLPTGSRPLHVEMQAGQLAMWALVDPKAELAERRFRFSGTGHDIDYDAAELRHVGTVLLTGGALVFHLFEVLP